MDTFIFFDYIGVALFAATGALAASRKRLDPIGFLFLSTATGIGGGTVRDLVIGSPVFWVQNPVYLIVCIAVATVLFFSAHLLESRYRVLLWLDAIALSAYATMGAYKGLIETNSGVIAVAMGMFTGTLGGIIRDLLSGEPSVLMRREIYVAAAMSGASTFVILYMLGVTIPASSAAGFLIALVIRVGSLICGWILPAYKPRTERSVDEVLRGIRH
jgi:uncharacterized membrane protein YeiH